MIETVKKQGDGYLLNGNMSVPSAAENRHFRLIQAWILEGNAVEPEFSESELMEKSKSETAENARAELREIDINSIRAIREYIAAQSNAPQLIKDREAAAAVQRAKLK